MSTNLRVNGQPVGWVGGFSRQSFQVPGHYHQGSLYAHSSGARLVWRHSFTGHHRVYRWTLRGPREGSP